MKHTTEEMKALLEKIQKKYGFSHQSKKFDNCHITKNEVVNIEAHNLIDESINNRHNNLHKLIEDNKLWGRCIIQYVNPIILTYTIENGVGGQYFNFPNSLDCNIFDDKCCLFVNTESSFDVLYEKYKKSCEDYFIKIETDIKQAKIQLNKDNIEKMFNPNYVSPLDETFNTAFKKKIILPQ